MNNNIIKAKNYKEAKAIFQVLDNKVRLKILDILNQREKMTVSEIADELKLFHSVASLHLRILKKYKILKTDVGKDTRKREYSINKEKLVGYNNLVDKILQYTSQ